MTEQTLDSATATTPSGFLRVIDLRGQHLSWNELRHAVPRQTASSVAEAEASVRSIIDNVRSNGAAAVREYAQKFDRVMQEIGRAHV